MRAQLNLNLSEAIAAQLCLFDGIKRDEAYIKKFAFDRDPENGYWITSDTINRLQTLKAAYKKVVKAT